MLTADCINNQSTLGRNLTPVPIIESARKVLGQIDLDFASDELANEAIQAKIFFGFVSDGYRTLRQTDSIIGGTAWLNPPGRSYTGGGLNLRLGLQLFLSTDPSPQALTQWLATANRNNDDPIVPVTAAAWYRALFDAWQIGKISSCIWMLYRGGSFGSLGTEILSKSTLCLTASGCPGVNGSGRISFETVDNGKRIPQTSNTQSSIIGYLGSRRDKFAEEFRQYGVIK